MSSGTRTTPIPRSRGVVTGLGIVLLGVWGAVIPFVGPYFHYAFASTATFHFTWERLWLDVIPGAAVVLGGGILILADNRRTGVLGAGLAAVGGAWFAVGVPVSTLWQGTGHFGIGAALGGHVHQAAEWVGFFYGLGAAIVFLAAFSMGRLSALSVRDVSEADRLAEPADTRPAETTTEQRAPETVGAPAATAAGATEETADRQEIARAT